MLITEQNIGDIIRYLRCQRGWTRSDLADKAYISLSTMVRIENGERNPSLRVALNLFEALGRPINITII